MKQLISRFKFRGDYEIVYGFERMIYEKVHHLMKDAIVVPIPLGKERLIERGFNQAEAIAAQFPCKTFHLLTRSASEEKQSKKSKQERLQTNQPLFNVDFLPKSLKEKKILIVDDIYTTGTTIRHAAKALIKAGVKDISSFTLVRS
jgi:competence protein ComFC